MSLTKPEIQALMEAVAEAIKENVLTPVGARLRAIEARLGMAPAHSAGSENEHDLAAEILAALEKNDA